MDFSRFSKDEIVGILDIIHSAANCNSVEGITEITARVKDFIGAEKGIIAIGDKDGNIVRVINHSYPVEWLEMYIKEDFVSIDPVMRYNVEIGKTALWKEATALFNSDDNKRLMSMASEYGLNYGIVSGIENYKGTVFSFASSTDDFTEYHKNIIDILTPHLHQALKRICTAVNIKNVKFSIRESEVLQWMKEGKTDWEISAILAIKECTVKFHVKNIKDKLGATNKSHAVAMAMELETQHYPAVEPSLREIS